MYPMEQREVNIQDELLNRFKQQGTTITVFLTRGNRIVGKVLDHDRYTILLEVEGQPHLIYKHAVSTIVEGG
ncbi:RNA chaperone Hfq [Aquifex aeolicus]|uniref:RNA chaperone Hfq n=1 Tax=Aquifex aeolicus TaxID=63363 RepID=UPI0002EAC133|nr:RNA chaperone Hfq [Aquifex aeolicus]